MLSQEMDQVYSAAPETCMGLVTPFLCSVYSTFDYV